MSPQLNGDSNRMNDHYEVYGQLCNIVSTDAQFCIYRITYVLYFASSIGDSGKDFNRMRLTFRCAVNIYVLFIWSFASEDVMRFLPSEIRLVESGGSE